LAGFFFAMHNRKHTRKKKSMKHEKRGQSQGKKERKEGKKSANAWLEKKEGFPTPIGEVIGFVEGD